MCEHMEQTSSSTVKQYIRKTEDCKRWTGYMGSETGANSQKWFHLVEHEEPSSQKTINNTTKHAKTNY